jgi:hypothetical protein
MFSKQLIEFNLYLQTRDKKSEPTLEIREDNLLFSNPELEEKSW